MLLLLMGYGNSTMSGIEFNFSNTHAVFEDDKTSIFEAGKTILFEDDKTVILS